MEIPEQLPPKPEDRSRVEIVDGLVWVDLGNGSRMTYATEHTYRDDWRWMGMWVNFGEIRMRALPPRFERVPVAQKRPWLARLFAR